MKLSKISLLAASMLAGIFATGAHAQVVNPNDANGNPVELHAVGATSITYSLVQDMNCLSKTNPAGNNNNTTAVVPEGAYASTTKPLDCSITDLQPNNSGKYVGTGSGAGRAGWRSFSRTGVFNGTSTINPFDATNTDPTWAHYHFTFSDGAISQSDQTTFVASSAANSLGNAIQIPIYVLPVAIAYNPVYGHNSATGQDYRFAVKVITKDKNGFPTGGLRLSKVDYCGIMNGTITNWNDAGIKTRNGNVSLQDLQDPRGAAGWASEGVPIRLVGRSDSSGTTDIFSRHLAAVCGADVSAGGTNKFQKNAGGLPWNSVLSMSNVDAGTVYKGAFSATAFANNIDDAAHQSLSGAFFDKTTNTIVTTNGSETPGKFMIANGSTGVAQAILLAADKTSTLNASIKLNGKVGYIGADFVAPAPLGTGVFSAALQVGTGTAYAGPTAANATAAFGTTILPPQTTATSGAYSTADTRTIVNPTTGVAEAVDRANPLHWTGVLYADPANTLANPAKGYAMTGTTMILPYQCYADKAYRLAVANLIGLLAGKATKEAPTIFDPNALINPSATTPGINTQSGIASLPSGWRAAITETFLKKSTQASGGNTLGSIVVTYDAAKKGYYTTAGTGGNGLWIQSALPTTAATVNTVTSNPGCTAGAGA